MLKEGRQRAGLSLKEVAERTCIRRAYLEALEADRYDLLPGEVYVQGFARLHAKAVGLDEEPLLEQIRRQKGTVFVAEDESAVPARRSMPAALRWALLAVVVIGVAGGLLFGNWQAGVAGKTVPAVAAKAEGPAPNLVPKAEVAAEVLAAKAGDVPLLTPPPTVKVQ
jgi:cytoskeletal protein RodZ